MRWCLLLLLAACAPDAPGVDETLAARRAALGLGQARLDFEAGMRELEKGRFEEFLAQAYAGQRTGPEVLEAALRIENLVERSAPPAGQTAGFREQLLRTRELASALARAAAGGEDVRDHAGALLDACMDCHVRFRKRR